MDFESADKMQVRARNFTGIFGEEHIFLLQCARRVAIDQRDVYGTGYALIEGPANVEVAVFEKPDEASLEA